MLFGFPLTYPPPPPTPTPPQAEVQTSRPALHAIIIRLLFRLFTWQAGVTRAAAVEQLPRDHDIYL